ncbi:hypothetical protein MRY87_09595 [bacterium]|nr:hypothetical protein [bacterium]
MRKLRESRTSKGEAMGRMRKRMKTLTVTLQEIKQCKKGEFGGGEEEETPGSGGNSGGNEEEEENSESGGSSGSGGGENSGGGEENSGTDGDRCIGVPSNLSAGAVPTTADYYVCDCRSGADSDCVAGSDANSGISPSQPFQTYEAARQAFASLSANQTIAFCQGGSFAPSGSTTWVNTNCKKDSPCTVQNYAAPWGSGDENLPILSNSGGGIFDLSNGGDSQHEEGYTFRSLDLRGNNVGVGVFIFNDVDDINLEFLVISDFQIGVQIAGANPNHLPGSDGESKRISLYGSRILNNSGQGFLGGGDDVSIDSNYFENNGFEGPTFYHSIYWADPNDTGTDRGIIRCNEVYRSTQQSGSCSGTPVVSHGVHTDLLVEGNYVHEDEGTAASNCWGMTFDSAYLGPEEFKRLIIRRNKVENLGDIAIGCTSCTDAVIENNLIIKDSGFSTGIAVPNRARGTDDAITTRATVRNNTVYFGQNASGIAISIGTEGDGYTATSNAIYYAGSNSAWACFDLPLSSTSYSAVDNNLCYYPNSSGEWEFGSGDLSAWSSSGFDQSSQEREPNFSDISSDDFEPDNVSSPLVDTGHPTLSSREDITGQTRSTPDIGAFEL